MTNNKFLYDSKLKVYEEKRENLYQAISNVVDREIMHEKEEVEEETQEVEFEICKTCGKVICTCGVCHNCELESRR